METIITAKQKLKGLQSLNRTMQYGNNIAQNDIWKKIFV